jgi:hypothetical protein
VRQTRRPYEKELSQWLYRLGTNLSEQLLGSSFKDDAMNGMAGNDRMYRFWRQ